MYPYWLIFSVLLIICVVVVGYTRGYKAQGNDGLLRLFGADPEAVFQRKYLIVYFLVVSGDWLQGPYVYALYQKYGFSNDQIAQLFVAGFGASMLLGTFVGSLADAHGRRKFSLLYAFFYIVSCLTKHVGNYWVLMFGRVTGGIATSLLFSVFEAWVVKENSKKGFDQSSLNVIFSLSIFLNSVSAILAGTVAQFASDTLPWTALTDSIYYGGFVGPFDLAVIVLVVAGALIFTSWEENFGEEGANEISSIFSISGIKESFGIILSNRTILFLGLIQSCFEGSMYAFVFEWTPALNQIEGKNASVPFGLVFATFMVGCMLGSQLFGYLIKVQSVDQILRIIFLISGGSLGMVLVDSFLGLKLSYFGFIAFEVCVGIYFPCMSTLKSKLVPEEHRASIYNLYRIPLNAIVLFVLLSKFTVTTTFGICVGLLFIAAILQSLLITSAERKATNTQEV